MKLDFRKVIPIGFGHLSVAALNAVYNLLMPLFLQAGRPGFSVGRAAQAPGFGLSAGWAGAIMSLDNVASLIILPLVGFWSDRVQSRVGRRYPFILSSTPVRVVCFALLPVVVSNIDPRANGRVAANREVFGAFLAVLLLYLLAQKIMASPFQAILPDNVPPAQLSRANGVVRFLDGIGTLVGALVLAALFDVHISLPFWGAAVLFAVSMVTLYRRVPDPTLASASVVEPAPGFAAQLRAAAPAHARGMLARLIAAGFFLNLAVEVLGAFVSSYATTTLGLDVEGASRLYGTTVGAFILATIPAGLLGTRWGQKSAVVAGLAAFVGATALIFGRQRLDLITVCFVAAGISYALARVNLLPLVIATTGTSGAAGLITGLYFVALQLAAIVGPPLNGVVVEASGGNYGVMFILMAVSAALALPLMLWSTP